MKIVSIGGGPAGLYFSLLMKKHDPSHQVEVWERNRPDDTFGFGVVFSDATIDNLEPVDKPTYDAIRASLSRWDDIDIHHKGRILSSTGHGFSGLSRVRLLNILQKRCADLGVVLRFQSEVKDPADAAKGADLVLAADGVNSLCRERYKESFRPHIDWRPNRFCWLGTTFPYRAFTFWFRENEHGLWRVHAYRYDGGDQSTFILETTEAAWRKAGLENAPEEKTAAYAEKLFAEELQGHRLIKNRSLWRSFPIIRCDRWIHDGKMVIVGDAAHTAHFSIGSGTKLAMEDAIALRDAVVATKSVPDALAAYEKQRRPVVDSLQRAARVSLQWFEDTERYWNLEPEQFATSLLTRSLRVTHENLKLRDPKFTAGLDAWFAGKASAQSGAKIPAEPAPPPMFTPFKLRDLLLPNRVVVSPMCQYSADDGLVDDWHLVHLGSRAMGGAGLVIAEATGTSAEGRITPGCAGIYKPEHVPAWKRVTSFVHRHTGAKIGIQHAHAGRKSSTCIPWKGGYDAPLPSGGWPIVAPSAIPWTPKNAVPREMDRRDMDRVRDDFVRSTRWAEEAGFDLLELHFAHGYLISTFLSALSNHRGDAYGGSMANRLRYPLEVLDAVRAAWPARKPLSVRISGTDWAAGGNSPAEAVEIAKALKEHGCDIVDVSAGGVVPHQEPTYGRLFQTPISERVRLEAGVPTMTVGAITSFGDVNSILVAGRADLCVLARAHLWDPYWTRHAAHDQGVPLEWPDPYKALERFNPRFK